MELEEFHAQLMQTEKEVDMDVDEADRTALIERIREEIGRLETLQQTYGWECQYFIQFLNSSYPEGPGGNWREYNASDLVGVLMLIQHFLTYCGDESQG